MKLKKESKIRIMENFYSLDYVFFGKPVSKVKTCCPVFIEEYLSIKGSLLSLMIEIYQLVRHSPPVISEAINTHDLFEMAKSSAKIARDNSKKLVVSVKGRSDIKTDLNESISKIKSRKINIEKLVQDKIRTKAFSLAVDNLLIGRTLQESKKYEKLNTWNGRILEDAYKILRDNLVNSALGLLESTE